MLLKQLENAILIILRGISKESWEDVISGINMIYGEGYLPGSGKEALLEKIKTETKVKRRKKNIQVASDTKKSYYGNQSVPIGNDELGQKISEKEIKDNIKKSKETKDKKIQARENSPKIVGEIKCTDCGENFQSIFAGKDFGSLCVKCMKSKARNRNNE